MPTIFCTHCGHENPDDSRFCASCGNALARPGHPVSPERQSDATTTISISGLEVLEPRAGRRGAGRPGCDRGTAARRRLARRAPRPERRQPVPARCRVHHGGPPPGERHLPRRRDGFASPRRVSTRRRRLLRARRRQSERHVCQPRAHRRLRVAGQRRGADRQVPAGVLDRAPARRGPPATPGRVTVAAMSARSTSRASLCIGEVLTHLRADFPDVTISKIRFLESEGLVEPDRTSAGYRKFSHADVHRLRYVLDRATRSLPAAAGHQGPPRSTRSRARTGRSRQRGPAGADGTHRH